MQTPLPEASEPKVEPVSETIAPVARIVSDKPRHRTILLEWPVEFDGKLYETVTVRRLTATEVVDFVEKMSAAPDARFRWPMYDVPDAVLDAADDDDLTLINKAITDFLPRRFRADPDVASAPSIGDDTGPRS